jgi:hypothetical protein
VNLRLLLCIAMGVFVAHIGVFMLLSHLRPKAKSVPPPQPNFSARATVWVNAETGEKTVHREITVSTKFTPATEPTPPPEAPAATLPASAEAPAATLPVSEDPAARRP